MSRHISKTGRAISLKFSIRNAVMDIMTQAKFHFNRLMLTLIFSIRASEAPIGPGERLKTPGLIGLTGRLFVEISWTNTAINVFRAMLINYIYLTYIFKSYTMQHVFLTYNSQKLFHFKKSNFYTLLQNTSIRLCCPPPPK